MDIKTLFIIVFLSILIIIFITATYNLFLEPLKRKKEQEDSYKKYKEERFDSLVDRVREVDGRLYELENRFNNLSEVKAKEARKLIKQAKSIIKEINKGEK